MVGLHGPGTQLDTWNTVLEARQARDWSQAIGALRKFLIQRPGDRLARLHLKQAQRQLDVEHKRVSGTSL